MKNYEVPYSFEIKELANGMFEITIRATGFISPSDAERFLHDINTYSFDKENKGTIH